MDHEPPSEPPYPERILWGVLLVLLPLAVAVIAWAFHVMPTDLPHSNSL